MTKKIEIIVGSMLGTAEYLADYIDDIYTEKGLEVNVHLEPNLSEIDPNHIWLLCCSTHGAGDLPDNIIDFYQQLSTTDCDLSHGQFAVIALGDSSYDTYCQAGLTIEKALKNKGSTQLQTTLLIDAMDDRMPEEQALDWIKQLANTIL